MAHETWASGPQNEGGVPTGPNGPSTAVPNPAASAGQSSDRELLHPDPPSVRLCHLVRVPDFQGYGFTLHEDKERKLETVLTVEPGSPAQAAGLRVNDIIIEVNGVNVEGASHQDILERIKSTSNETRLLVADENTAAWYKERSTTISRSLPSVIEMSSATAAEHIVDSSPKATVSASSTSSQIRAAGLLVPLDDQQQVIEYSEQDPSKVNLMVADTDESFLRRKQQSGSDADAAVRRRAPADRPAQTSADEAKLQVKTGPKAGSASAADKPGERAVPCMHLSPLETLEWMLRAVIPMQLPLPMLVGLVAFLLLALYYFYSYVSREQQT
ncbi:uncharacterized protein LOC144119503 [Amblyomma americanum]